jgi:glycine betaine/proline transport system substrate-binding protein
MKRQLTAIASVIGGLALLASVPASAAPESKDPIKLTINDWTGQYINTHIMGEVLKHMGYNVKYVQADYLAQFTGLESGDLDVAMEIWRTTGKQALEKALATKKVVDLGDTGMQAREEWWYPLYMKDRCPGLPDWKALQKCAKEFATPETSPKGRYLGGPVTWGGHDDERVKALGLNFDVVHAGTDAALHAEVKAAIQRKAPIVAWVYQPDWLPAKYKGEYVEFPKYTEACYHDKSWGTNKNALYDCGKPYGWIKKVGWVGMEKKWPGAYKAVQKFHMDNQTIGNLIAEVALDGKTVDQVTKEWMDANKSTWMAWTK